MNATFKTDIIAIRKLMVEKSFMTISSLADAAKINRNTLGKILDGSIQPSSDIMCKLIDTLQITPEQAGRIFFKRDLHVA